MIIKSRTFARCNEESSHLALMTTPASRALATALDQALNTTFWQTCSVYVCVCVCLFVGWQRVSVNMVDLHRVCIYVLGGREGGGDRERESVCVCVMCFQTSPHTQKSLVPFSSRPSYAGNRRKGNLTHIYPDRHMQVIDAKEILHTSIQTVICR